MDQRLIDMIGSAIDSVWALELLLLLWRQRGKFWNEENLVAELRSSSLVVRQSVAQLQAAGLVIADADGSVRYAAATPELDELVARLDEEYRSRPAAIRRIIVAPSDGKLQSFSDAFLFRKPSN